MPSLLLYGGTFNPIHCGHVALCRSAQEMLHTDEVLLMPTAVPPHKAPVDLASDRDRFTLCRLAARPYPGMKADGFELRKGGASYTIDTLEHLRGSYPGWDLYLLMGTDMFLTFREWKRWREIGSLATLVVGSRDLNDCRELQKMQQSLREDGVFSILLKNSVREVSSTQIRKELREKGLSGDLPAEVQIYIRYRGLYESVTVTEEPDETLQELLRAYLRPMMREKRYLHSLGVERQAVYLARKYGVSPRKAAIAGLLHDLCKDLDQGDMLQKIRESGIINGIDFAAQPQLIHGYAAPLVMEERLGIDDPEILDAARYHTTGRANMSPLEQVVYLADLTSEERDYPDIEETRSHVEHSLEDGMAYALRYTICHLKRLGQPVCPDTQAAYQQYGSLGGTE